MDHRWHSDSVHANGVRLAAMVLPWAVAAVGTLYALVGVYPDDTNESLMVAGLFWAGLGGAFLARRLAPPVQRVEGADPAARLYDEESRLGNRLFLRETLSREIARNQRLGAHCTLVVFDTRLVGSESRHVPVHVADAPAFMGRTLKNEARGTDYVARIDQTKYAALLAETGLEGARFFASRVMQLLAATPCTRGFDGAGVFVRAIATGLEWTPNLETADAYIDGAIARLANATGSAKRASTGVRVDASRGTA